MRKKINCIVMGASAGGLQAIETILEQLSPKFELPIILVQHRQPEKSSALAEVMNTHTHLKVIEVEDKMPIQNGYVFLAPADYHLLINPDKTFSLSSDSPVHYCRPSVDVLFETAAECYQNHLIGVLLTGANQDGSQGLAAIKQAGGITIVQDPSTAYSKVMIESAIKLGCVDHILKLSEISHFLNQLKGDGA